MGGNPDTSMTIFSADTLDFLVIDIFLEEGTINFFLVTEVLELILTSILT